MKKILIIVDSFSGLLKEEADKLGFGFLPQTVIIDGKVYRDGIDLKMSDSIDLIKNCNDFKTSMPPVGKIMDLFEEVSPKYDEIVFFPMNKGLSSTSSTVTNIAKNYKNIHIMDSILLGGSLIEVALLTRKLLEEGKSIVDVEKIIKKINDDTTIYILPKDILSLIKGGRLYGARKSVMEKAKLVPKLKLINEGFKTVAVKRNFTKMIVSTIQQMAKDVTNINDYNWEVFHTGYEPSKKLAIDTMKELGVVPSVIWVPPVVTVHFGVGGVGVMNWPKQK